MNTVKIGSTSKGKRVWLQGLTGHTAGAWNGGDRYNTIYSDKDSCIFLYWDDDGKRKVTDSKGGIIDIVGAKVTAWADGATMATVTYTDQYIIIKRA